METKPNLNLEKGKIQDTAPVENFHSAAKFGLEKTVGLCSETALTDNPSSKVWVAPPGHEPLPPPPPPRGGKPTVCPLDQWEMVEVWEMQEVQSSVLPHSPLSVTAEEKRTQSGFNSWHRGEILSLAFLTVQKSLWRWSKPMYSKELRWLLIHKVQTDF